MRFPRTSRTNPCPICGTHKSKCGWREDDIKFRFCMNLRDAPPGWKYVGETKNSLWGMFVPDTQREYTEEERIAFKKRRINSNLKQRAFHAQSLSDDERDRQCNKLIDQLSLHNRHLHDLRRRGLSDELIRAGRFRSVDQFHKLDFEVSYNLAGVDISGIRLTNKVIGYIVPVWNELHQIIGYQIRNDDNSENAPKYIWATSKRNKRRKKPATAHLQNSELPLTFCVPESILEDNRKLSKKHFQGTEPLWLQDSSVENRQSDKLSQKFINLAEGILKPWIMAQLRGLLVIGAAGGNFASSPETLKRYIEAAKKIVGDTKQVVLWADAGAIANKHVMREYRKVYYLLKKWGYNLRIAWWGQIDKNCLDGDEYLDKYELITWGQFEGMSRYPNRLWDSVKKEFNKIKKLLRLSPKKQKLINKPFSKSEHKLEYVPGFLPSYGEYVELGCPTIVYKNGERATIWNEFILKGWTHILDKSAPGLGKSHTAGSLSADDLGMNQLMYLASDHRNPTTLTIEKNYYDVFPRHGGLQWDDSRLTPSNRQFLIHPNSNDDNKTPGNCARHHIFASTREKNLNLESSKNIICQGCNLLHKCQTSSGKNYGYLSERTNALKYPQIRLHPDSTPLPESYDYSQIGIFWDEASVLMRSKNNIDVRISDLYQTVGYHATANDFEDLLSESPLIKLYKVLLQLFELDSKSLPRYGLNDDDILLRLGKAPQEITRELIADLVENLSPDLEFLWELSDTVEFGKKGAGKINRLLRDKHNKEVKDKLKSLPLNWLVPMLEVWVGYVPGYFSFNNGVFTIHQFDSRHRDVARAAAFNIYLDGTMPVENLSLKLGVPREHILLIETEVPDYSNLEIIQINDMGVLGRDRRESQLERVSAMREALVQLELKKSFNEEDVGFIERKAFAREGDGYHFRDSRGINRFSDKKAIISIGAPYSNIGEIHAEYGLLMKDKYNREKNKNNLISQLLLYSACNLPLELLASFICRNYIGQDFIDGLVIAEILQEIGRLRSHLRLDESLTYYFVGDYDLSLVLAELPGVKYNARSSVEISPMSAGKEERTKLMVMTAIGNLIFRGIINPKQKEVVQELEAYSSVQVTQGRISQLAKEFGGWRAIVKLVENTLRGVSRKGYSSKENFEDKDWIIQTYLPLIVENYESEPVTAIQNLIELASVYGWDKFREMITELIYNSQQKLIELVLDIYSLFDVSLFDEFFVESG